MTQPHGKFGIQQLCTFAGIARAGYYRHWQQTAPAEADLAVRDHIQRICLEHRFYGYRRVRVTLRQQGLVVNAKKVLRLMRQDNLLALRHKKFVTTTDSQHRLPIFPNLATRCQPLGTDQLWVADLTYIRLSSEFVYLAVVLDRYSRRVVGWQLGRTLQVSLALQALRKAIAQRPPAPGLIHHSDRGIQYASHEYVALLHQHQMTGSMSRPGYPYDNAHCESFMKTLKQEEIDCRGYATLEQLEANLTEFIELYYNRQRLHSALGYQSPEQFEQSQMAGARSVVA